MSRYMPLSFALASLVALASTSDAFAHCFVGARFFPATLATDDPCVAVVAPDTLVLQRDDGARGLVRPSPKDLQVVLGPIADQVAREMREALGAG